MDGWTELLKRTCGTVAVICRLWLWCYLDGLGIVRNGLREVTLAVHGVAFALE